MFEVEIVLPGGQAYPEKGRVNFADPSFSQQTGSFLVRAVLPNPENDARHVRDRQRGAARARMPCSCRSSPCSRAPTATWSTCQGGRHRRGAPGGVGDYYGAKDIFILTGLQAGDRVVVDGAMRVVPASR